MNSMPVTSQGGQTVDNEWSGPCSLFDIFSWANCANDAYNNVIFGGAPSVPTTGVVSAPGVPTTEGGLIVGSADQAINEAISSSATQTGSNIASFFGGASSSPVSLTSVPWWMWAVGAGVLYLAISGKGK